VDEKSISHPIAYEVGTDTVIRNVGYQTPYNAEQPKNYTWHTEHGESLKLRTLIVLLIKSKKLLFKKISLIEKLWGSSGEPESETSVNIAHCNRTFP
jgi:hypothetical protein